MRKHPALLVTLLLGLLMATGADAQNLPGQGRTLEDFFTAALEYSPDLMIAAERVNVGSARSRIATGRLLPQLNANVNLSDNRRDIITGVDEYDGRRYSLQLSQVLFNWQAFSARRQATLVEDQLEAEYFDTLSNLLTEVAERYFNVLQAEDALTSINAELEAVSNQLDQIQSFYDRQLARVTDLYEAQASLAAVQAEMVDVTSELELAKEGLRAITGLAPVSLYRLNEEAPVPPVEDNVQSWVEQALTNNHQIRARQFALRAAGERVSETRGAYMPRVNLIVSRQNSDLGYENAPVPKTDTTYLGVDISIPLYAGGSNRAGVRESMSQQSIAENELRQIEAEVSVNTRLAFLQAKSSETRTVAARRLAESTALAAEASQTGFELGAVTSVDVLNALRDRFSAERDLQRARYEHVKYLMILKQQAGTLTADDLLEVGTWLVETPVTQ